MRLAGVILIACGFVVVLLPANWPDVIQRAIRYSQQLHRAYLPLLPGGEEVARTGTTDTRISVTRQI